MDKKDMFMTGVKATISAVPVVGGSFASIISDVYSDRKEAKLTEFVENFKLEMESLYQTTTSPKISMSTSWVFPLSVRTTARKEMTGSWIYSVVI